MTDSASQEVRLDLRLVGYFVAVAEHCHFGRAATALRVAQPSLSRQIGRLEQLIGVRLFDRTPQSTRLTEAGEVFLPRARELLRSAVQATAQARDRPAQSHRHRLHNKSDHHPGGARVASRTPTPTCKPCTWTGTNHVTHCWTTGWTRW